jgi:type II secretory pathway pseudopilin PulG
VKTTARAADHALTLIEVVIVLTVLTIAAILFLPALARMKAKPSRVKCVNNLKNVSLAYRIFATDNNDRFPFEIPGKDGGTREFTNDLVLQIRALSNELATPNIVVCPTRTIPQIRSISWTALKSSNISYYINLSASESQTTNGILAGDAGFKLNGQIPTDHPVHISSSDQIAYPPDFHENHNPNANLAPTDGSVSQIGPNELPRSLAKTGMTNFFLLP